MDKRIVSKREKSVSTHIPYARHFDDHTLETKSGSLIQIFKLEGVPSSTNSLESLDQFKYQRNELLKSISDEHLLVFTHSIRRRVKVSLPGQMTGLSLEIQTQWQKHLDKESLFVTDHYITLVRDSYFGATKTFRNFVESLFPARDKTQWKSKQLKTKKKLDQDSLQVKAVFAQYRPQLLGVRQTEKGYVSEPLGFLHYLINGESMDRLMPRMDLSKFLPTSRPLFGSELFELRGPSKSRYGAVFGIKEYPNTTEAGHFDELFKLKQEFVLTQTFDFVHKQAAKSLIKQAAINLRQAEDDAISQQVDLQQALDDLAANRIRFGEYYFVLQVSSETPDGLDEAIEQVHEKMMESNVAIHREDVNLEAAFWAQLPGNESYGARKVPIHSGNFSGFASFHGEPRGQETNNRWGDCITVLPTENGSPYYFNFHLPSKNNDEGRDKGHTRIIGPNGSGKTLIMTFLASQAQQYNGRMIYFDKDRASEIFIRSLGGQYSIIQPGTPSGLNPLQLPDTPENRDFLFHWFTMLLKEGERDLSSDDKASIDALIEGNYSLDFEQRRLSHVAPFIAGVGSHEFKARLEPWLASGRDGYLFDNEFDVLNLNQDCFGVDFSYLLSGDNTAARTAVAYYFFHRLEQSLDGRPTLVPFDEGWAYLDSPYFEKNVKNLLKTIRKKEGVVIFATQDPVDSANSSINSSLNQEISTEIYFANKAGKAEHYCDHFELTEREFERVKTLVEEERKVLLKQGTQSVVLNLNLGAEMSRFFPVLSGRTGAVDLMDSLMQSEGEQVTQWLPKFMEAMA